MTLPFSNSLCLSSDVCSGYYIYGNTPIEQADIICLANHSDDPNNWEKNVKLINGIGLDLLLVEYFPSGQLIRPTMHPLTQGLSPYVLVKGFEDSNFCREFRRLRNRADKISALSKHVLEYLKSKRWNVFLTERNAFQELLTYGSTEIQNRGKRIQGLLRQRKYQRFGQDIHKTMKQIDDNQQKLFKDLYNQSFPSRITQLCKEMEEALKLHGKTMVLVDSSLIVRQPYNQVQIKKMKDYLSSRKSVTIVGKTFPYPVHDLPELWTHQASSLQLKIEENQPSNTSKKLTEQLVANRRASPFISRTQTPDILSASKFAPQTNRVHRALVPHSLSLFTIQEESKRQIEDQETRND